MFGVFAFFFCFFLSKKGELEISNRASDLTITKMCFGGVCKTKCRVVEASAACPASDFDFERIAFQINLKKNTSKGFRATLRVKHGAAAEAFFKPP